MTLLSDKKISATLLMAVMVLFLFAVMLVPAHLTIVYSSENRMTEDSYLEADFQDPDMMTGSNILSIILTCSLAMAAGAAVFFVYQKIFEKR